MVLVNVKVVRVSVPADNESTLVQLCPSAFSISLSRLGCCRRTCNTTEVFIVGGERIDFGHEHCVGGSE